MQILAHRGCWNGTIAANSPEALKAALAERLGFESDVRDYRGRLVISHNIVDGRCFDAEDVFRWLAEHDDRYCFAVNIKADGLKKLLQRYFAQYGIRNYFLFDMSVPQMVEFRQMGLRYFTRQSEYETHPVLYDQAAGVWIDGFTGVDWITRELLAEHLERGKEVCIVSPELHGCAYMSFWELLRSYALDTEHVFLCTDHPAEARDFFDGTHRG